MIKIIQFNNSVENVRGFLAIFGSTKKIAMSLKTTFLFICAALIHHATFSQDKTLDKRLKAFDQTVAKVMADWKVQGVAVAIVEKNRIVLAKGYGFRDADHKVPVTAQTQFAIGSCTKAFTAATVCLLKEDNLIDLDKPVKNYLPKFALYDEYASNNITPRDLLCHRSGLPRHDLVWYGSSASRAELVERLKYLPPTKPFRTT